MIKVGQIYKTNGGNIFCVIRIDLYKSPISFVHLIELGGFVVEIMKKNVEKELSLITEYPTWQEDVNSKEFNE